MTWCLIFFFSGFIFFFHFFFSPFFSLFLPFFPQWDATLDSDPWKSIRENTNTAVIFREDLPCLLGEL